MLTTLLGTVVNAVKVDAVSSRCRCCKMFIELYLLIVAPRLRPLPSQCDVIDEGPG